MDLVLMILFFALGFAFYLGLLAIGVGLIGKIVWIVFGVISFLFTSVIVFEIITEKNKRKRSELIRDLIPALIFEISVFFLIALLVYKLTKPIVNFFWG